MSKKWACHECGAQLHPTCYYCRQVMTCDEPGEIEAHLRGCKKRPVPEMQQLVECLDISYAGANIRMLEEASATGKQYTQGYIDALDETLKHIRTKFLGEEK